MKLTDLFLAQLERETASTRRALERVPEGQNDWKPHEKSMPLGYLAALVASMPSWIGMMIALDEFVFDENNPDLKYITKPRNSNRELLEVFDESVAEARLALSSTNDDHLMKMWRFIAGGHVVSEQPRYIAITDAVFSHLAHHRGQLTVYLRLHDKSVPSIYGPSGDEKF